ncbi:DUF3291 domain-containing protein [Nocardiopsis sp. LOL_012]|uniref:DUF3291 domain-containing protein n=1 Tax=Nocardiopsis sp. LOL_012 TaxID=3345409 RepID=UPI003A862180
MNIARMRAPLDDPAMSGFTDRLDGINALAEGSPGFVWRLVDGDGDDATGLRPFGDDVIVNMSVWETVESLWNFTYRSGHMEPLRLRRQWFEHMGEAHAVLWWIPAGTVPTLDEAGERLDLLRTDGPSAEAFTFRSTFPPPPSQN